MNLYALMGTSESGASAGGSMATTLITFVLIILIFWFLIIRPQRKKDKEAKAMLAAIKKGDKVVTIGGIHGTVVMVKDTTVILKVDDSARIEFNKNAISSVLNKDGTPAKTPSEEKKEKKAEEKAEKKAEEKEKKAEDKEAKLEDKSAEKKDEVSEAAIKETPEELKKIVK